MTPLARTRIEQLRAIVGDPPAATNGAARRTMIGNKRRDSAPEIRLRRALHKIGLRYRVDYPVRVAGMRPIRPDLVFTRARVLVFVDGCFWHGCPQHGRPPRTHSAYWAAKIELNQARDERQTQALTDAGWVVLRIWEHEPLDAAAQAVLVALCR